MKKILISLFLIILIGCNQTINLNETSINQTDVKYDSEILNAFNQHNKLPLLVRLKDNSNITLSGSKEERIELLKQRKEWFKPVIDAVLTSIPEEELNEISKSSDGFSGNITKKGFELLLNNPNVKQISWINTIPHQI